MFVSGRVPFLPLLTEVENGSISIFFVFPFIQGNFPESPWFIGQGDKLFQLGHGSTRWTKDRNGNPRWTQYNSGKVTHIGKWRISLAMQSLSLPQGTVDGRNPAPVEVGSFSHYLQGFIPLRWCRISSINSISSDWKERNLSIFSLGKCSTAKLQDP